METKEIRNLRNHPTYMIESSWGAVLVLFMMFFNGIDSWIKEIQSVLEGGDKATIYVIGITGGIVLFFLIALFFSFFRWRKTTLTVADGSLTWEQATIFSKRQEFSISSISNVNLEQNLFERIVGTYKLKIDTSSISTAESTDMKIILGKKEAMEVRNLILYMMNTDDEDAAEKAQQEGEGKKHSLPMEDENYDVALTSSENFMCAVAGIREGQLVALIIILLGLNATLGLGLANHESIGAIFATVLIWFSFLYSVGKELVTSFLRTYNFKVARRKDHIYITSGAIKIRSYSVPVNQIQAIRFQSTLIGRIMKRVSVSVINVSGEGEDVDGQWLLPAIAYKDIPTVLERILPEMSFTEQSLLEKRPKSVQWRELFRTIFIFFVIGVGVFFGLHWIPEEAFEDIEVIDKMSLQVLAGIVWIVFTFIFLIMDILRQKTEGILIKEDSVVLRRGSYSWMQVEVPFERIQVLDVSQSFIDRWFGQKDGSLHLLASKLASTQNIPKMKSTTLEKLQQAFQKTIY